MTKIVSQSSDYQYFKFLDQFSEGYQRNIGGDKSNLI